MHPGPVVPDVHHFFHHHSRPGMYTTDSLVHFSNQIVGVFGVDTSQQRPKV
ncbi:hypothetical protein Hanom_Chr12g01166071 [Helianthus anomalus]